MNKEYLNLVNEISEKIRTIKSEECIMHYDDKTELIEKLKKELSLTHQAETFKTIRDFELKKIETYNRIMSEPPKS